MLDKAATIGNVLMSPWHLSLIMSSSLWFKVSQILPKKSHYPRDLSVLCLYLHSGPLFQSPVDSSQTRKIQKGYVWRVHLYPQLSFSGGKQNKQTKKSHRIRDTKMTQVVDSRNMCGILSQIWNPFFSCIPSNVYLAFYRSQTHWSLNSHSSTSLVRVS